MAHPPKKHPSTDELLRRWESDKKSRVFLTLAEEYRRQDFVDAALSVLREGLKHHPNFQPAHVALARCYMAKRQYTEAQQELERVHAKSPDNILAGKLLAEVLEDRGEKARAHEILTELLPFAYDDPEVEEHAKRLEQELAGPRIGKGPGVSPDTLDFGTSDFGTDGGDTAGVTAGEVEPAPSLVDADAFMAADEATPEEDAAAAEAPTVAIPAAPPAGPLPGAEAGPPEDLLGRAPTPARPGDEDDLTSITLAELYESQGSFAEAATLYEKLLARRPEDPVIRSGLDRCRGRAAAAETAETAEAQAPPPPAPEPPLWAPEPPAAPAPEAAAGEPSSDQLRAILAEYERWVAAARAVRQ